MIVEYIRFRIAARQRRQFEVDCQRTSHVLRRMPECSEFELSEELPDGDGDAGGFVLRITWTGDTKRLTEFQNSAEFDEFHALISPYTPAIEERRLCKPTSTAGAGGAVPSLYEWAGGAAAFERLTIRFYDLVRRDDLLAAMFADMDPHHPHFVAMWLSEVFGGPTRYTTERGGYHHMLGKHLGKGITEPQRRRWVQLIQDAADQAALPSDPEFRAAFVSYLEWGTRLALANSQPGAQPPRHAPTPRWGWGVAPPYQG